MVSRLTAPDEMDADARAAGLEPEARFGDWPTETERYTPHSPLAICTYVKPSSPQP
ncbi:hypothetical protein [Streptomyces capitiformicae]|uniref:hypothetical protein n=1 Tax=Streptomyces capitiformicae TaxID=2014920 RepID=UPI001E2DE54E|nr:hypothetical protein [Streptomyces capitiformicae]